jgi:hypothetical protein
MRTSFQIDDESLFKARHITGKTDRAFHKQYDETAQNIIEQGQLDDYLGEKSVKSRSSVERQSSSELFENYDFALSRPSLSRVFRTELDIESIKMDILKATLYITDIPREIPLKQMVESYKGEPDGSDFFEEDDLTGPITCSIAKAVSLSSRHIRIPSRITATIQEWRDEFSNGESDSMDERMPNDSVIRQLLDREISSQYFLSRYLKHWPIQTSSPTVVFSGMSNSRSLDGYNTIIENRLSIGATVFMPYFISTSYDLDVAKRFTKPGDNIVCILLPIGFPLTVISETVQETAREILLNTGSQLEKVEEPTRHEGYIIHYYRLVKFVLPKKTDVKKKINEATEEWCSILGIRMTHSRHRTSQKSVKKSKRSTRKRSSSSGSSSGRSSRSSSSR